jgi:two-component system, chemotaxis family, CheB/CheR fusion protein
MLLTACKLPQEGGRDDLILLAIDDITERKRFEEHRDILVGELNHRIKNVMATVQAIASQTLSSATSMEEARETFGSRLVALGKSHDLLTRENWAGADLRDIVSDTVEPHSGGIEPLPDRRSTPLAGAERRALDCNGVARTGHERREIRRAFI